MYSHQLRNHALPKGWWARRRVQGLAKEIMIFFNVAVGFMMRVDQSIRNNPNIMELQFEIATKKEAIWRTNHINEWCRRARV